MLAAFLVCTTLIVSACERPWIEPQKPTIEVIEPDFTTVLDAESAALVVRADAIRTVESVTVNGLILEFDEDEQVWIRSIALQYGLNRLVFSVTDSDGQIAHDTTYAYSASLSVTRNAPGLPDGRGSHTTTVLQDGSILVLGGSRRYRDPARVDAALLSAGSDDFQPITSEMLAARTGHTANLLPDGRVLIAGGSRHNVVDEIEDLVETVEIFDPESRTFAIMPVSGPPIRRAFHTAVLRLGDGGIILDLFGGEGDIQYSPSPLLGTRNDIRSFLFRNDSLIVLSPAPGPNLGFPFSGHTQTSLDLRMPGRMLIAGTYYGPDEPRDVAAIIAYDAPNGLLPRETGSMVVPRTLHAAERIRMGQVLVAGGRDDIQRSVITDAEIYVDEAGRFFRFAENEGLFGRFGLNATKFPGERILLTGGFSSAGEGVPFSEIIELSPP